MAMPCLIPNTPTHHQKLISHTAESVGPQKLRIIFTCWRGMYLAKIAESSFPDTLRCDGVTYDKAFSKVIIISYSLFYSNCMFTPWTYRTLNSHLFFLLFPMYGHLILSKALVASNAKRHNLSSPELGPAYLNMCVWYWILPDMNG